MSVSALFVAWGQIRKLNYALQAVAPFVALNFFFYEYLKAAVAGQWTSDIPGTDFPVPFNLACGAIAGALAQTGRRLLCYSFLLSTRYPLCTFTFSFS
jgi:hypothetical protein